MPALSELATELGIDPAILAGKQEIVDKWNGYLTKGETDMREAQQKLAEAKAVNDAIERKITQYGETETTQAELQASNAALRAALDAVQKAGVNVDLTGIPQPKAPKTVDPLEILRGNVSQVLAQQQQLLDASSEYMRITGKPLPETSSEISAKAARLNMNIPQYMEHAYKLTELKNTQAADAAAKRDKEIADKAVEAFREANPNYSGNPLMNGGNPSNRPMIQRPTEGKGFKEFANLPAAQRIKIAMDRANQFAKSSTAA